MAQALTEKEVEKILGIVKNYGGERKIELRRELDELLINAKIEVKRKIRYRFNQTMKGV